MTITNHRVTLDIEISDRKLAERLFNAVSLLAKGAHGPQEKAATVRLLKQVDDVRWMPLIEELPW